MVRAVAKMAKEVARLHYPRWGESVPGFFGGCSRPVLLFAAFCFKYHVFYHPWIWNCSLEVVISTSGSDRDPKQHQWDFQGPQIVGPLTHTIPIPLP